MLQTLQPLLETALDAVVVMRQDGTIAAWNEVAEATFGWRKSEALGRPMSDLIIPTAYREAHCLGLSRYLTTGEQRVLNRRIEITALDVNGREFPIELSITTVGSADDLMFIGYLRDISERREAEARLHRQAQQSGLLFDVTRMAAETDSYEEALRQSLRAICSVTGWPVGHAFRETQRGSRLVSTDIWHEQVSGDALALREATAHMHFGVGVGLPGRVLATGEPVWIADADEEANFPRKGLGYKAAFGFPIKSEGQLVAVLEFFSRDKHEPDPELMLTVRTLGEQVGRVFERRRTEEHQRLLVNELNHRVKNTLAVVQSLANQTFKGEAASPAARPAFESRLVALSSAHDVLTADNWESGSIRELVSRTVTGCGAGDDRVIGRGPDVSLSPRLTLALGMALHELCTNAVKYGALSNETGCVTISWQLTSDANYPEIALEWHEEGGPPVAPPRRRGFGSKMIERALGSELGGTAKLDFAADGVICRMSAALR